MSTRATQRRAHEPSLTCTRPVLEEAVGGGRGGRSGLRGMSYRDGAAALSVQRKEAGASEGAQGVQRAARDGLSGGGGALPHFDRIQASFGQHDVSSVAAHTGGAAARACQDMGARAYASGENVALGGVADLHTVAHEAAHVVQQRAGVSLSGGVGRVGDSYEQHADAVADAVVQGKSAEPLLDRMAGRGALAPVGNVQQEKCEEQPAPEKPVGPRDTINYRKSASKASLNATTSLKLVETLATQVDAAIGIHELVAQHQKLGGEQSKKYDEWKKSLEPSTFEKVLTFVADMATVVGAVRGVVTGIKALSAGMKGVAGATKKVGRLKASLRKAAADKARVSGVGKAGQGGLDVVSNGKKIGDTVKKVGGGGPSADGVKEWLSFNTTQLGRLMKSQAAFNLLGLTDKEILIHHMLSSANIELSTLAALMEVEHREGKALMPCDLEAIDQAAQAAGKKLSAVKARLDYQSTLLRSYAAAARVKDGGSLGLSKGTGSRDVFDMLARNEKIDGVPVRKALQLTIAPRGWRVEMDPTWTEVRPVWAHRPDAGTSDEMTPPGGETTYADFKFGVKKDKADHAYFVKVTNPRVEKALLSKLAAFANKGTKVTGEVELTPAAGAAFAAMGVKKLTQRTSEGYWKVSVGGVHDPAYDLEMYEEADLTRSTRILSFVTKYAAQFKEVSHGLAFSPARGQIVRLNRK